MDITSLLSPGHDGESESPSRGSPTTSSHSSPRKQRSRPVSSKRTASGLSQELRHSLEAISGPTSHPWSARNSPPSALHTPTSHMDSVPEHSSSYLPSPHQLLSGNYGQEGREAHLPRPEAAPSRPNFTQKSSNSPLPLLRHPDYVDSQRSPGLAQSNMAPLMLRTQSGRSMADLTMAEAPSQTPPPRSFTSATLTDEESKLVTDLLSYLAKHSYAYASHVQLVNLLHKGFQNHLKYHADQSPRAYEMLAELRQARDAMDSRFAIGEELLLDWLSDEGSLANSTDERVAVIELFEKAVKDEPASTIIWLRYIEWIESNYVACHKFGDTIPTGWTEEDLELCRELFTREMLLDTLEKAADATRWRIDESHVIWNRWAGAHQEALNRSQNGDEYTRLREAFIQRLGTPHRAYGETRSMLWSLVQQYEGNNWEAVMAGVNELIEPVMKQMAAREQRESEMQGAISSGDNGTVYHGFESYISWENHRKQKQRAEYDSELRYALYERALLRFPTATDLWLEYVDLFISKNSAVSALPLLERATRHCPWSGDLWATRILRSDVERRPHEDIEATKHRATNSGLIDIGGIGELLKMLQQWCSYLRRHAFKNNSTEDDIDTAEVSITMALEDVQHAGGADATLLSYPLQTIHIKFFTESRRFPQAREIYRQLTTIHGHSAEFWSRYYNWELWLWGYERLSEARRVETQENGPHLATAVVQEALAQRNLDFPNQVLDMYMNHFQLHESGEKLEMAMVRAREFSRAIARKQAKEATLTAGHDESLAHSQPGKEAAADAHDLNARQKRKASIATGEDQNNKRSRKDPTSDDNHVIAPSPAESTQFRRDREHNTITIRNLPADVQENEIKKFFRDIDQPLSINILQDSSNDLASATVEFATHEDVLAAKTRDGKMLRGYGVEISSGNQSTLYVTNYPPDYDESAIRSLFASYGEIASVRFPSLKFNNRRRFCYVTFLSDAMAKSAEGSMDGKMLNKVHRLVAKISNPNAKKQRSGAQAEGREIYIKNLDFTTSEDEVKQFFSDYGNVVSMHLLKNAQNKFTGNGFVVFSEAEAARGALDANNKPFKDRILHVELAHDKGGASARDKAHKVDVYVKHDKSADDASERSRRGSDVSMASAAGIDSTNHNAKTVRERSAAILNLPDTVNDARIQTLMEKHGQIVKIQLRRREGGAVVEFTELKDAFNVRQGVDCSSLGPDVRSGEVGELFKMSNTNGSNPGGTLKPLSMRPATVSRPTQKRGGRRGGLGQKHGGISAVRGELGQGKNGDATAPSTAGKSNDEFRAMLEQSRNQQ